MDRNRPNPNVGATSFLPEELITEVMLRLPVKSLVRFRCVCKEWNSLTTNPSFIHKHFRNGNAKNSSITWNDENRLKLPSSTNSGRFGWGLPLDFKSLGFKKNPICIGQCDGVFCFYWVVDNRLVLCNPALRETRDLLPWRPETPDFYWSEPESESVWESESYSDEAEYVFGFGFDPNTNDYKVVKIVDDSPLTNSAEIYSMETGSWRLLEHAFEDVTIRDVDFFIGNQRSSHNSGGVIYWSGSKNGEELNSHDEEDSDYEDEELVEAVLSFNLKDEVFRLTKFPEKYIAFTEVSPTQKKDHRVSLLHGKLALLCSFFDGSHTSFDVWVMENDVGEDPWSHVCTVEPLSGSYHALCFWKNSELVIVRESGEWRPTRRWPFLYDLAAKKTKDLELTGELNFIYRESLVPVKGGNDGSHGTDEEGYDHGYNISPRDYVSDYSAENDEIWWP